MGNELDSAVDSLSEQTKKIDIASYYTHGDLDKARQMIAGTYRDMYVIKAKFSSSSIYGAFIIFFSIPSSSLISVCVIISHSYTVDDIKTNIEWILFEREIMENLEKGEHDDMLGNQLRDEITSYFSPHIGSESASTELKRLMDQNEDISVNHLIQRFLQNKLGFQNCNVTVDFEQTSSLDMEMNSRTSRKIDPSVMSQEKEQEQSGDDQEQHPDEELRGRDIKLILNGTVVLSPIKGREIGTLVVGDRIQIGIADKNPKAIQVARAFNAYNDGKFSPISGRIVSIRRRSQGGFKIFCIVAKGIYVRIEEEEENIKISLSPIMSLSDESNATQSGPNIPLMVLLVIVLILLIGAIIIFLG